ncbi:MAG: hypothetical protein K1X89_29390, partial [Myxococcaceae bacterium]|nr:hypothetical protein [Myxococcaceae bacterium]
MSQRSPWDSTLSDARAFTAANRFDDAERALKAALGTAQGAKASPGVIAALQLELGRALWRKGAIAHARAALEAANAWHAAHEP